MSAAEAIRAKLSALIENLTLPRSACSVRFLKFVKPLIDAAVLREEKSGAGRRVNVCDLKAVCNFFAKQYPDAHVFESASSRLTGVARFRDSKSQLNDSVEITNVRAWQNGVLKCGGQEIDVVGSTTKHGVFTFFLGDGHDYALRGRCALVENPEPFRLIERLNLPIDFAIYGKGRASNRLIDWLAQYAGNSFSVLHLPDYDSTGLNEYARLKEKLGENVELYIPNDLETRFHRFGKRQLLFRESNQTTLRNLQKNRTPEIRKVLELILRANAGLEQEALFLDL